MMEHRIASPYDPAVAQDRRWAVLPTSYDTALREPGHRHEASTQPHTIPSNCMQYLLSTAQLRTCIAPTLAISAHMQPACSGREDCAPLYKSLNLSETSAYSPFEERHMSMDGVWSGSQAAEHGQSKRPPGLAFHHRCPCYLRWRQALYTTLIRMSPALARSPPARCMLAACELKSRESGLCKCAIVQ